MKDRIMLLALAAILINSASATFVSSYNASTHLLSVSCIQPSSRNLGYSQNAVASSCTFLLTNVTESNSIASDILSNDTYTAPSGPQHHSVSCVNGEASSVFNNVSVSCPPSISYGINLSASNHSISNTIDIAPNVTLNYRVNGSSPCIVHKSIVPAWGSSILISNSSDNCRVSLNISAIPKINSTFEVHSGQNISNSTYGFRLVGLHTLVNVNKTLQIGQDWIYSPDNISLYAPKNLSQPIIAQWYNSNVAADCLNITTISAVNGSDSFAYCSVLKNNQLPTIQDICTEPQLRNVSGFSQCLLTGLFNANQSAHYWNGQYVVQKTNNAQNYSLYQSDQVQLSSIQGFQQNAILVVVFFACMVIAVQIYFNVAAKKNKDTAKPLKR